MEKSQRQTDSPWGEVQSSERVADGIAFVSTASHGGYYLTPARTIRIRNALTDLGYLKNAGRCIGADIPADDGGSFWEEDCAAAFVVVAFPPDFPDTQKIALDAIRWLSRDKHER